MKDQKGEIKTNYRTAVQRVEGVNQAPQFMINDKIFYVRHMNESYVTSGLDKAHHRLYALVGTEDIYSDEVLQWFDLHLDYSANTYELTRTEPPKEG